MGEIDAFASTPVFKIYSPPSSSFSSHPTSSPSGANYIEHKVCKMDTLAGIAIKYGVEVADIRRLNGLVTDLQMFARKSLQIPLPGRHPPSPIQSISLSNRDQASQSHPHTDISSSSQSSKLKNKQPCRVSMAMSSLQGYYGLTPPKMPKAEGTEMIVYRTGVALHVEDESLPKVSPAPTPQPLHRHMSTGSVKGFMQTTELYQDMADMEVEDRTDPEKSQSEKSVRRRQKADVDPWLSPDIVAKEDAAGFTARTMKGPAARPNSGSRTDMDFVHQTTNIAEDTFMFEVLSAVKKSSSTSNLQESDNRASKSSSKWTFKADSIAKPIFDGLQKPIIAWRSKAALD